MITEAVTVHWLILVMAIIGIAVSIACTICLIILGIIGTRELIITNKHEKKVFATLSMVDRYCSENPVIVKVVEYIRKNIKDESVDPIITFRDEIKKLEKEK